MSTNINNINRITGLSGIGIDTEKMVSELMKAERVPLDKLMQKRQVLLWQQEDYRKINTTLLNLRNTVFNMKLQGTYLTKKATSSNEAVVTASASTSAANATYVVRVDRLASIATNTSSVLQKGIVSTDALAGTVTITAGDTLSLNLGGQNYTVALKAGSYDSTKTADLDTLVSDLQASIDAALGPNRVTVSLTADKRINLTAVSRGGTLPLLTLNGNYDPLKLAAGSAGTTLFNPAAALGDEETKLAGSFGWNNDNKIKFAINGQVFEFSKTDSLNTIISTVNARTAAGVSMFYDQSTGRIGFATTKAGDNQAGAEIQIRDIDGTFVKNVLNFDEGKEVGGESALVNINGVTTVQSSNTFTLNGVTFNLKSVSSAAQTVTVASDIDSVVSAVKDFVDKYNSAVATISDKYNEARPKDGNGNVYDPLTDDQKEGLSEDQIKEWTEKAKTGLLYHDSLLGSVLTDMRSVLSDIVGGMDDSKVTYYKNGQQVTTSANSLSVIGITTGSWTENGKLYLDEDRLRQCLQSNPDAVMKLFTNQDTSNTENNGIAVKLYDTITAAMKKLTDKAGSSSSFVDQSFIGQDVKELNTTISAMEDRLDQLEERYWNQFTLMEQYISQMNAQSAWLTSMLGGTTSS